MVVPYLNARELDAIWQRLESGPGRETLSPNEEDLLLVFQAIGNRDGKAMAEGSRRLLTDLSQVHPFITTYLVGVGMLGSIIQEEPGAALALWETYRPRIQEGDDPQMIFQFLLAHSRNRIN